MEELKLSDINRIRELSKPENLKGCAKAYGIVTDFVPALCDLAERFIKANAFNRVKNSYFVEQSPEGWFLKSADGYQEFLGAGDQAKSLGQRLAKRVNYY